MMMMMMMVSLILMMNLMILCHWQLNEYQEEMFDLKVNQIVLVHQEE